MLGIKGEYEAFCLDQAIAALGNGITAHLESISDKDPKRAEQLQERELRRLLGLKQKFAEPPRKGKAVLL
jgi:hypothetical protein